MVGELFAEEVTEYLRTRRKPHMSEIKLLTVGVFNPVSRGTGERRIRRHRTEHEAQAPEIRSGVTA